MEKTHEEKRRDRRLDKAGGENESYHTALKCCVDFDFFYKHHVPEKLLPKDSHKP